MRREPDFEESADMRLVELHRASLGVAKPDSSAWKSVTVTDGITVDAEGEPELQSAMLALELRATPESGVIPGAIVTLALSITNEGSQPARNARVRVPLPGGAGYRNGSLVRDGRAMSDETAEGLLGDGLAVGDVAPGTRISLLWKIGVRIGNKPLVIAPSAQADESAIVGAKAIVISRKDATAGFTAEVEQIDRAQRDLPIYELDEEETIEYEAGTAALSEYEMPSEPPAPTGPAPAEPAPSAPDQPVTPVFPEQPPDVEPAAAARTAVVLFGSIDRPSVAYFDRVFNAGKPPTLLSHFVLAGALACTRTSGDGDDAALEQHMQAQRQLLQRAALHEKLGKKEPIEQYTGSMIAQVDRLQPDIVREPQPADANVVILENELHAPALAIVRRMKDDAARWDFTKARQVTLALQAQRVLSGASEERISAANDALRSYAQVAATQLQRFFVRMRLDRTTGLLFTGDPVLDAAARRLIAALRDLY